MRDGERWVRDGEGWVCLGRGVPVVVRGACVVAARRWAGRESAPMTGFVGRWLRDGGLRRAGPARDGHRHRPGSAYGHLEDLAAALHALDARVVHYVDAQGIHAQRRPLAPELFEANPFLHLFTAQGRVDVLLAPDGLPRGVGRPHRPGTHLLDLDGLRVTVADIRDLITTKEASGRPRDLADDRVQAGAFTGSTRALMSRQGPI